MSQHAHDSPAAPWWQTGVIYQIYPRSFADTNGDGVGDIAGITAHLDHLAWLGIDAIWLSPITVSPNADWGYDVADFCAVEPELGTIDDFGALVDAAHALDIRVLLDFVPNHTSDRHPWFVDSRSARTAEKRDWYLWADPAPDGGPPNNWISSFGGPGWTLDDTTGQYYMHNHLVEQPDLNWWNDDVRATFDDIIRFWFDRGVDGFRIDVCNIIIKDAELRDNPPATEDDPWDAQMFGQSPVYNANRPEVHDVLRHWRDIAETYDPPRLLLGETPVEDSVALGAFYGPELDELQLAFNFPFINAAFDALAMPAVVESTYAALPDGAWPAWTGSNHDMSRFATRWAHGDEPKVRAALVMLLGVRGTPVLYQGDEIGQRDTEVDPKDFRDPLGVRYWPAYAGRDAMRTPMQWGGEPGAGFTEPDVRPWLPFGDLSCNVAHQRGDRTSTLHLTRDLLALRRATPDLTLGNYTRLAAPDGVWAWRRGEHHAVAINCSDAPATVDGLGGRVLIASDRALDDTAIAASLSLPAWTAAIVRVDP